MEEDLKQLQSRPKDLVGQVINMCSQYIDGPRLKFLEQQVRMYVRQGKRKKWTPEQNVVALALNFKSPSTYNFLQTVLVLPPTTTLKQWLCSEECIPGYHDTALTLIEKRMASVDAKKKVVIMCFDEMLLSEGVMYKQSMDMVIGFVSSGPHIGGTVAKATHALVVMVRCMFDTWEQPIGYFFIGKLVKGETLKMIIVEGVERLHKIGLDVKAIVTRQSSNSQKAFASLGVTENTPFFSVDQHRVWCVYDPPHLLSNVTSNLMRYTAIFDSEKCAQWNHIMDFYTKDSENSKFSLAPNLTMARIFTPPRKKMHIRQAAQVLSRTVAAGLSTYVSIARLPSSARDTAEFIAKWNDIFDSVSGRSWKVCETLKKPAKMTTHLLFWKEAIEWLREVRFDTAITVHCLDGWKLTLQAICGLMCDLQDLKGFKFLRTSRLSLDCLERLFTMIRQKAGNCDKPNPNHFCFAFQQTLCSFLIKPSSSSCELSHESVIQILSELNRASRNIPCINKKNFHPSSSVTSSSPVDVSVHDMSFEEDVDVLDSSGVKYILGHVLKKLGHCCDSCNKHSLRICGFISEPNQALTLSKAVKAINQGFGGLVVPSNELVHSFYTVHSSVIVPFLCDLSNFSQSKVGSRLTSSVISRLSHLSLCSSGLFKIVNAYCKIVIYWKIHKLNETP